MAFDFCKNVKGQEYEDKAFFVECGKIAKELGLEWGSIWRYDEKNKFPVVKVVG